MHLSTFSEGTSFGIFQASCRKKSICWFMLKFMDSRMSRLRAFVSASLYGSCLAPLFEWAEMSYEVAMTVSFEKPCRILSQDAQRSALVSPERRQLLLEKYERAS